MKKKIIYICSIIAIMFFLTSCTDCFSCNGLFKVKVTWCDYDGTVIEEEYVPFFSAPNYEREKPFRLPDEKYIYTFKGWDPFTMWIITNQKFTAQYDEELRSYSVTWKYEDTVLEKEQYSYGWIPKYRGNEIIKKDSQYTYKIVGWSPKVDIVTKNVVYEAKVKKELNKYSVSWNIGDSIVTEEYSHGDIPNYSGETPYKEPTQEYNYKFIGWDKEISPITNNITYTAVFEPVKNIYTVTWCNYDGTVLETDNVEYGALPEYNSEEPKKMIDLENSYPFISWDKEISPVTDNITYTAVFNEKVMYLSKVEDLKLISENKDYTFILKNDIDCNNNILPVVNEFNGSIIGNNFKIYSFILQNESWINKLNGEIKDLKVEYLGSVNTSGSHSFGLVKENFGVIDNLEVVATFSFETTTYGNLSIGLVCATNKGIINNVSIKNSTMNFIEVFYRHYKNSPYTKTNNYYLNFSFVTGINEENGKISNVVIESSEQIIGGNIVNGCRESTVTGVENEKTNVYLNVGAIVGNNSGTVENGNISFKNDTDICVYAITQTEEIRTQLIASYGAIGKNTGTIKNIYSKTVMNCIFKFGTNIHANGHVGNDIYAVSAIAESKANISLGGIVGLNEEGARLENCLADTNIVEESVTRSSYAYIKSNSVVKKESDNYDLNCGLLFGNNKGVATESGACGSLNLTGNKGKYDLIGVTNHTVSMTLNIFAYGKVTISGSNIYGGASTDYLGIINNCAEFVTNIVSETTYSMNKYIEPESVDKLLSKDFIINKLKFHEENWKFADDKFVFEIIE